MFVKTYKCVYNNTQKTNKIKYVCKNIQKRVYNNTPKTIEKIFFLCFCGIVLEYISWAIL